MGYAACEACRSRPLLLPLLLLPLVLRQHGCTPGHIRWQWIAPLALSMALAITQPPWLHWKLLKNVCAAVRCANL